jgi:hypothetical protein
VNGTRATLPAVTENDTQPAGNVVSAVFANFFSDADDSQGGFGGSVANNFAGVAVVANGALAATGTWQFAVSGSAPWADVGTAVTNNAALLLGSDARIRFVPAPNFIGTVPGLTVRLVEDSSGALTSGTTADVSVNGDPTRYSAGTVTAGLTVTPASDVPRAVLKSIPEDSAAPPAALVRDLFASLFSGTNGSAFAGVVVTSNAATPVQGRWEYLSGGSWVDLAGGHAGRRGGPRPPRRAPLPAGGKL